MAKGTPAMTAILTSWDFVCMEFLLSLFFLELSLVSEKGLWRRSSGCSLGNPQFANKRLPTVYGEGAESWGTDTPFEGGW
jgi:hypothetical protein